MQTRITSAGKRIPLKSSLVSLCSGVAAYLIDHRRLVNTAEPRIFSFQKTTISIIILIIINENNLRQMHECQKELDYTGSYDRVAAFVRQWKAG